MGQGGLEQADHRRGPEGCPQVHSEPGQTGADSRKHRVLPGLAGHPAHAQHLTGVLLHHGAQQKVEGNDPGQPAVVHDRQLDPTFDLGRYRMTFQELLEGAQESGYIAVRKESQEISPG